MKVVALSGLALGIMTLGAGGWAAWNSTAIAHRDVVGAAMHIEVVAPQEPDLPPPTALAVGDLRDDYVHDPERLRPPAVLDAEYAYLEADWSDPPPVEEPPLERTGGLVWTTLRPAPIQLEPHDYSFGFDQPLPAQTPEDDRSPTQIAAADTAIRDEGGLD